MVYFVSLINGIEHILESKINLLGTVFVDPIYIGINKKMFEVNKKQLRSKNTFRVG